MKSDGNVVAEGHLFGTAIGRSVHPLLPEVHLGHLLNGVAATVVTQCLRTTGFSPSSIVRYGNAAPSGTRSRNTGTPTSSGFQSLWVSRNA
jgi:hypothetical protein